MEGSTIGLAGLIAPRPQPQETILQLSQELVQARANDMDAQLALFSCQQDLAERLAEM